jgi:hypothetical protein
MFLVVGLPKTIQKPSLKQFSILINLNELKSPDYGRALWLDIRPDRLDLIILCKLGALGKD